MTDVRSQLTLVKALSVMAARSLICSLQEDESAVLAPGPAPKHPAHDISEACPCWTRIAGTADVTVELRSVFKLILEANAAARIVLWRRSLRVGGPVAEPRLQFEALRELDVHLDLTEAGRVLSCTDVHAIRDVPSRLHGGSAGALPAGALRSGGRSSGAARLAATRDRESIEAQSLLHLRDRIESATATADAAQGSQSRADLGDLQCRQL